MIYALSRGIKHNLRAGDWYDSASTRLGLLRPRLPQVVAAATGVMLLSVVIAGSQRSTEPRVASPLAISIRKAGGSASKSDGQLNPQRHSTNPQPAPGSAAIARSDSNNPAPAKTNITNASSSTSAGEGGRGGSSGGTSFVSQLPAGSTQATISVGETSINAVIDTLSLPVINP